MQIQSENVIYYPRRQLLLCKLCNDVFKKPITLTCGHTFCYSCLHKFMKQNYNNNLKQTQGESNSIDILSQKNSKPIQLIKEEKEKEQQNIPLPLCASCNSLVIKPIKSYKENLVLSNLISNSKIKPNLKIQNYIYDQSVQNFTHQILINIQKPKIEPLPFCLSQIRFSTCFLDDILERSHSSYVIIQWPGFKQNIGLAGKITRSQMEYHSSSSRSKQNHYRAIFHGMFFVTIKKRKPIQINLKARYYYFQSQGEFYDNSNQYAILNICTTQVYHSQNILPLQAFNQFFSCYDKLNNPHYLNQIYRIVDPKPLFERNDPQGMIYCCIRILKLKAQDRKLIVQTFDDHFRIQKINQFIQKMKDLPNEDYMHITIPGKYNSAFVFAAIIFLFLLHYMQNG